MVSELRKLDPRLRALTHSRGQQKYTRKGETAALVLAHDQLDEAKLRQNGVTHITRLTDHIWSVRFAPANLRALHGLNDVAYMEAPHRLLPALVTSVPNINATPQQVGAGVDGREVVIGIIDYGIDWTLPDFCEVSGTHTRIKSIWDQSLECNDTEQAPEDFAYGVEYDEQRINEALAAWRDGKQEVAKALIRHRPWPAAGGTRTDTDGHGTHVAGIACGNGASRGSSCPECPHSVLPYQGVAPGAWIVFVHLSRGQILGEVTSSGSLGSSPELAEAIAYCYRKADQLSAQLGRRVGCVVNLSMGFNGGSHDGESLVERCIDTMLEAKGRALVVAAGNQRDQRTYYTATVPPAAPYRLTWKMGGPTPDTTVNEMEIWYRSDHPLNARLFTPSGQSTNLIAPGETLPISFDGFTGVIDSDRFTPLNGDARIYIQITPAVGGGLQGAFGVELTSPSRVAIAFDAWIEKEAGLDYTATDPRQSRFPFLDPQQGQRATTLTVPATARRAVAVGGLDYLNVRPPRTYPPSGAGPTRDGRPKPEVVAPATDVCSNAVRFDRTDATTCAQVQKSGTSMAAPHVTGVVALMLQLSHELSADQIKSLLVGSADQRGGGSGFDPNWGYGVVNAAAVLDLVRQYLPATS